MINPLNQVNVTLLALRHTQAANDIEASMRRLRQIHLNSMSKCTRGYCILHHSSAAHEKPLGSETGPGGILSSISPVCHLAPRSVNSAVRICQTRATESAISLRVIHGEDNVNEKKRNYHQIILWYPKKNKSGNIIYFFWQRWLLQAYRHNDTKVKKIPIFKVPYYTLYQFPYLYFSSLTLIIPNTP